jgi:hypothetical protein
MQRIIRAGVLVALAASTPWAFAANLIPNPDFTRWLNGWAPVPDLPGIIEADFTHGVAPPSAHVYGDEHSASSAIRSPCVAVDAASIDLSFETFVVVGTAQGGFNAYSDDACETPIGGSPTSVSEESADWTTTSLDHFELPAGTKSVQLTLFAAARSDGTPADVYFDHVALGPAGTLPEAIPIDQVGLTGAWYNPAQDGQGFQLTLDPATASLFGAWYTYDAVAGDESTQRWYSLQATLSPDAISADVTIYRNVGGTFAGPPATTATPVGTGTLAFDSCTGGMFAYTFDDGRQGEIALRTLPTPFEAQRCDELGGAPPQTASPTGLSGTWYDPTTSGQGMMINIDSLGASVFAGWYTYDSGNAAPGPEGQRWFSAQGAYDPQGGHKAELTLYSSTGGTFDGDSATGIVEVGHAVVNFEDCANATMDYTFDTGPLTGTTGSIPLARLGSVPDDCAL